MKISIGKYLVLASLGLVAVFAAVAVSLVSAQSTSTTASMPLPPRPKPMVVEIGPGGRALLRGTLNSVASTSLTVKTWGGVWTVNISSNTEILPHSASNDISRFSVGDFVGVSGQASENSLTIDAAIVRDWTYKETVKIEKKENKEEIKKLMKSSMPRNWQGTAGSIGSSTLMLTIEGELFTVNLTADAKVVNRNWLNISLSDVLAGDTVRVWGPSASSTITASVLRDISIPR